MLRRCSWLRLALFGLATILCAAGTRVGLAQDATGTSMESILAAGESQPAPPATVLDAVLAQDIGGLVDYLRAGEAGPGTVGARAVAVIRALEDDARTDDARALQTSIAFVSQLAAESVCAPPVIRVAIDSSYRPPAARPHLDFGGWRSALAAGWFQLTASAAELQGLTMSALDRIGRGAVFADAVDNVEHFAYALPNGRYRVILLTPETSIPKLPDAPFGQRLFINGVPFAMGNAPRGAWLDGGRIDNRAAPGRKLKAKRAEVGGSGGMVVLDVGVANGILEMHFLQPAPARGALLSGIIIEPAAGPSAVVLQGQARVVLARLEPTCREHGRQATAAVRAAAARALEG